MSGDGRRARKVLVTGSTGFLGASLVERLLVRGETDLRCFVRPGSDRSALEALARAHPAARLEYFTGNLTAPKSAADAVAGMDVVYHLAASLNGAAADMYLNTVVTSKHLLDAVIAQPAPPRVVLVSSFGVYGVAGLPRGHVVTEETPLEEHPERRDLYSQTKLRQERLFWDVRREHPYPLVVLRPGVIYGPRGSAFSQRVGLNLAGIFLFLGGDNLLPLSYVESCADSIALAGQSDRTEGQAYNVHDDELRTARQWLRAYEKSVRHVRKIAVPYPALMVLSRLVERYHERSKGQLPAVFTPYKTATTWGGNGFDNGKIKALGFRPLLSTEEAMRRTFEALKARGK